MRDKDSALYLHIGRCLRNARRALDLQQSEVAKALGMTRTSIVNIECGNQALPIHRLYEFCKVLKLNPNAVLPSLDEAETAPVEFDTSAIDERIHQTEERLVRLKRKRAYLVPPEDGDHV